MKKKIKIVVSSCLLGSNVRYDGGNKINATVQNVCETFECLAICPENAIGLGIPRPALQIVRVRNDYVTRGKTNPEFDVTDQLQAYAQRRVRDNPDICG